MNSEDSAHSHHRDTFVFLRHRHAQGRRGLCWSSRLLSPPRSPSWTWPCPTSETGTRNSVSKSARSASTVSWARGRSRCGESNLIGKNSNGHFFYMQGENYLQRQNMTSYIYKSIYLQQCSSSKPYFSYWLRFLSLVYSSQTFSQPTLCSHEKCILCLFLTPQ